MKRTLLLTLLTVVLAACAPTGHTNAGFTSDVTQFLSQRGLPTTDLKCYMLGNGVTPGPEGMCLLTMTDSDVNAMTAALGLQPKQDTLVAWMPTGPDCWTRLKFNDQSRAKWYTDSAGGNLQLNSSTAFVYFRLFYYPDDSAACISLAYPTAS